MASEQEEFEFRARAEKEAQKTKQSLGQRAWTALAKPEQMSREGLNQIAGMLPNSQIGNLPRDIAMNTPRIAAETMAQVAPGFVSPGSLLTAGALRGLGLAKPFMKMAGEGLASQLESASGAAKGSLSGAAKDASLIFSRGKDKARPLYDAAEQELKGTNIFKGRTTNGILEMEQGGQNMFRKTPENIRIVRKAIQATDSGRILEPSEALTARKAVDAIYGSKAYSKEVLVDLRQKLDSMAKASENIAEGDPLYKRGVMGESLRNLFPQNKYGGASAFKMGIAPALSGLGGFVAGPPGAAAGAGMAAGMLSPAVQGVGSAAAGLMGRKIVGPLMDNPQIGSMLVAAIKALRKKKNEDPDTQR